MSSFTEEDLDSMSFTLSLGSATCKRIGKGNPPTSKDCQALDEVIQLFETAGFAQEDHDDREVDHMLKAGAFALGRKATFDDFINWRDRLLDIRDGDTDPNIEELVVLLRKMSFVLEGTSV